MVAIAEITHGDESRLWTSIARSIRPIGRVSPSEWSEANVRLSAEMTPVAQGRFDAGWKPWTKVIHDILDERQNMKGVVGIKPSQIGFTRAMLNVACCHADTQPGPMLYIISDYRQAAHFADEQFMGVVDDCPRLRESFDTSAKSRRENTVEKPFLGGRIDFVGAGSVSGATSRTYRDIFIDEYDVCLDNFPSGKAGSLWQMAIGRQKAVVAHSRLWVWSHPRKSGQGVHELYERVSTKEEWVWDCPHCETMIRPRWSMVHFPKTEAVEIDEDAEAAIPQGEADPDLAVFRCPHCGEVVTDGERARQVWAPERGGTGRLVSELDDEVAASRDYIGLRLHRLCDPDVTIRSLAREFVFATSEEDRQGFYNLALGEEYTPARMMVTEEMVGDRIDSRTQIALPGGIWGVQYITVGVDVQHPKENPSLVTSVNAWTTHGFSLVLDLVVLRGWPALFEYLSRASWPLEEGGREVRRLSPILCSVDSGYLTGQVYDNCRLRVTSSVTRAKCQMLPVRYRPHVKSDAPALMPSELRRTNPSNPAAGPIECYDLHRNTWVDRTLSRYMKDQERVSIWCPEPKDFRAQMTANILTPVSDRHGYANDGEMQWVQIKLRRDDWLQAQVYSEVGASLKLGLDRLHERAHRLERRSDEGAQVRQVRKGRGRGEMGTGPRDGWF